MIASYLTGEILTTGWHETSTRQTWIVDGCNYIEAYTPRRLFTSRCISRSDALFTGEGVPARAELIMHARRWLADSWWWTYSHRSIY